MSKIYLLYYDVDDDSSREAWSVFYTPAEAFPTAALRRKRKDWLKKKYDYIEFYTTELEMLGEKDIRTPTNHGAPYEDEEDED